MSSHCIFCEIVKGNIPCTKVYEDDAILAFMDIGPVVKGHTLVIPKAHHNPITNTPVELLQKLIAVVQQIARAQLTGLDADGVNISQANGETAGQIVPHLHFHVIPRFAADGHHWNWIPHKYDNSIEMNAYADRIRQAFPQGHPAR
jgi:histidine triad (HIT) family protein